MLSLNVRTCSTTKSEFDMEKSIKKFINCDIEKPHNLEWMKEIGAMNAALNGHDAFEEFEGIITSTPTMWEKIKDFSLVQIFEMKDSKDEEHKEIYDAFEKTFYDFNPEKDVAAFLANPKIEPNTRTEKITLMLCYLYISCFALANIEVWLSVSKKKIDEVVEKLQDKELSNATSSDLDALSNADILDVWSRIDMDMTDSLNYSGEIVAMLDKGNRGKKDVNELIDKFNEDMYYDWSENPAEHFSYDVDENLNFEKLMNLASTKPPKKRPSASTKKSAKKQRRSQEEDEEEEDEDEEDEDEDEEEEDEEEEDEEDEEEEE